jgi:acyl carrier protein
VDNLYRLQTIFRDIFDDPTLKIDPNFSVGTFPDWDSVATVQIVLAVESEFDLRLATDEVAKIQSVQDLLNSIKSQSSK